MLNPSSSAAAAAGSSSSAAPGGSRERSLSPDSDASSPSRGESSGDGSEDADSSGGEAAEQRSEAAEQHSSRPVAQSRSKRARIGIGQIASAALEQWGLDEARVLAWAAERGLPGIGIADLTDYRKEHPDEDCQAGLADLE